MSGSFEWLANAESNFFNIFPFGGAPSTFIVDISNFTQLLWDTFVLFEHDYFCTYELQFKNKCGSGDYKKYYFYIFSHKSVKINIINVYYLLTIFLKKILL